MTVEVAVVFQASSQLTAHRAKSVIDGVGRVEGARAHLLDVAEFGQGAYEWTALDKADAIVFGAPTYLGAVPAEFRRFRAASARRRWTNKLASGFTCPGSVKEDVSIGLQLLAAIAEQHGMWWVDSDPAAGGEELGRLIAEAAVAVRSSRSGDADQLVGLERQPPAWMREAIGRRGLGIGDPVGAVHRLKEEVVEAPFLDGRRIERGLRVDQLQFVS